MFEKEAEEYEDNAEYIEIDDYGHKVYGWYEIEQAYQKGAEYGYNNATEDVKHNLMMKLKDEGIVKPLKDSIFRNERLSSQEQQELCAWIECAIDFGENLDECAKELEEANKANEWHYVADGDLPKTKKRVLVLLKDVEEPILDYYRQDGLWNYALENEVIAWKEIVLPEPSKYWDLSTGENNINKENE